MPKTDLFKPGDRVRLKRFTRHYDPPEPTGIIAEEKDYEGWYGIYFDPEVRYSGVSDKGDDAANTPERPLYGFEDASFELVPTVCGSCEEFRIIPSGDYLCKDCRLTEVP